MKNKFVTVAAVQNAVSPDMKKNLIKGGFKQPTFA